MSPHETMHRVDALLSHMWMVRTFLKHSDESAEDDDVKEVHRELYDYMLALGPAFAANDATEYLAIARKKFTKVKRIAEHFREVQPEISSHMNFRMAALSLGVVVADIEALLGKS